MSYVICSRNCENNRLVYYTGTESFYGGSYYGSVLEAKRFEEIKEVTDEILRRGSEFFLGFNVIYIANVTFEKLQESLDGDEELYRKFHDPLYAIR